MGRVSLCYSIMKIMEQELESLPERTALRSLTGETNTTAAAVPEGCVVYKPDFHEWDGYAGKKTIKTACQCRGGGRGQRRLLEEEDGFDAATMSSVPEWRLLNAAPEWRRWRKTMLRRAPAVPEWRRWRK